MFIISNLSATHQERYSYSKLLFFLITLFIHLVLAVLGPHCCLGFSLAVASRGYSLAAVCEFLIVVQHRLLGKRASIVRRSDSVVAVPGL